MDKIIEDIIKEIVDQRKIQVALEDTIYNEHGGWTTTPSGNWQWDEVMSKNAECSDLIYHNIDKLRSIYNG